jgi:hypothetical protein
MDNSNFGAPYLLYVMGAAMSAGAWWFAQNILIPVRDDHREFLRKLDRNLEKLSDQVETLPCRVSAMHERNTASKTTEARQ